jgi:hypothetical protein
MEKTGSDWWDYKPHGEAVQVARVVLNSKTWHPTRMGILRFEARVMSCSNPSRVKIGGKALSDYHEPWLIGPWDSFAVKGDVEAIMVARFDPSFDLAEVARAEGLSITIPDNIVWRTS